MNFGHCGLFALILDNVVVRHTHAGWSSTITAVLVAPFSVFAWAAAIVLGSGVLSRRSHGNHHITLANICVILMTLNDLVLVAHSKLFLVTLGDVILMTLSGLARVTVSDLVLMTLSDLVLLTLSNLDLLTLGRAVGVGLELGLVWRNSEAQFERLGAAVR